MLHPENEFVKLRVSKSSRTKYQNSFLRGMNTTPLYSSLTSAVHTGFEPAPNCVTGRHLSHLTYVPFDNFLWSKTIKNLVEAVGLEPTKPKRGIYSPVQLPLCDTSISGEYGSRTRSMTRDRGIS
jgi:hypothetical protein